MTPPPSSSRWLILLTIINLANYLDRYLVAAVGPKISAQFALSEFQLGFTMSAFMFGYMIFSPVFGPLGDRGHRPRLMALGVFAWAVATFFSGLATGFVTLIGLRVLVGIGEASFSTIAPGYIKDQYPSEVAANRAFSLFYLSTPLGAALAYIIGGLVADHLSWRWAFWGSGCLAATLGILVSRLPENRAPSAKSQKPQNLPQSVKDLWRVPPYRGIVVGYVFYTFAVGGFAAWAPRYGEKVLGATLTQITSGFGAVTVIAAVVGTILGGRLGSLFLSRGGTVEGFSFFCAMTSVLALPFTLLAFLTPSLNSFLGYMLIGETLLFAATAPVNMAIVSAAPRGLATTAIALSTFLIHAFGDLISPPLVGWLSDRIGMRQAMLILPAAVFLSAVVWWRLGLKRDPTLNANVFSPLQSGIARTLQWIFRHAALVFFREVRVLEGERLGDKRQPPENGYPTLYIANHPNGLIDPLLVYASAGEGVRFVAKNTLWKMPLVKQVLNLTGAVPVFRAQDRQADPQATAPASANVDSLRKVSEALGYTSFLIFPEGKSHGDPDLSEFKTGPTRILLSAATLRGEEGLQLGYQPVGLYFDQKSVFRSRALVHFGVRRSLADVLSPEDKSRYLTNPSDPELVRKLTAQMQESVRAILPVTKSGEVAHTIRDIATLLLEPHNKKIVEQLYQREVAVRQIVDKMDRNEDSPAVQKLKSQIKSYFSRLQEINLSEAIVRNVVVKEGGFKRWVLGRQLKFWGLSLLGLPFIGLGLIFYYLPYRSIGWLANKYAEDQEEVATYKFILGVVTIIGASLIYGALISLVAIPQGMLFNGLLLGFSLPGACAGSALLFGERLDERAEELRVIFSAQTRQQVNDLGTQRQTLVANLWEFYEALKAE